MRFLALTLVFLLFTAGCSNQPAKPSHLIPEDTYINLLIEMQLLKTYQDREQPDSTKVDSLRRKIFQKYDVTEKQFSVSHNYYQQDLNKQASRIKEAIERLRKDQMEEPDTTAQADSAETGKN